MRRSRSRDINVERLSRNRERIVGIVGQRNLCVTSCPLVMFFRVDSDTSTSRHGSRTSISDLERKRAKPTEQNGIQGKSVLEQLRVIQFIQPGVPSDALKKDFREEVFYVLSNSCTIFVGFVSEIFPDWNIPCADIYHPRYIYQQIPYIRYLCITKYKIFGIDYDKF